MVYEDTAANTAVMIKVPAITECQICKSLKSTYSEIDSIGDRVHKPVLWCIVETINILLV